MSCSTCLGTSADSHSYQSVRLISKLGSLKAIRQRSRCRSVSGISLDRRGYNTPRPHITPSRALQFSDMPALSLLHTFIYRLSLLVRCVPCARWRSTAYSSRYCQVSICVLGCISGYAYARSTTAGRSVLSHFHAIQDATSVL